jgi:hypothetical protein
MHTQATMKRLALAFLLPVVAVAVGIGVASRGDDAKPAEAAGPVAVRALAPDLYDYFIDGDNDTLSALAVSPANGLNVGGSCRDQSSSLGGTSTYIPIQPRRL